MSLQNDYKRFEFREGGDNGELFQTIVKFLILIFLLLSVILLGSYAYRILTSSDNEVPLKIKQEVIVSKQNTKQHLSQQEMAIIIQTVISELQKQQSLNPPHITKKSEDSELLKSLQEVKLDKLDDKPKVIKKEPKKKVKNIVAKKAKPKIIKKEIVYNAVIIGHKEIKNTSDLARLYASINKISRSKKRKILKSAYTKKIKKEIIIREGEMRTIVVRAGDTLGSIAQRAYGKASMYKKILDANPDLLNNPHKLRVGMRLRVPN